MIVVDTGVIFAVADAADSDHRVCDELLASHPGAELVVPTPVTETAPDCVYRHEWAIGDMIMWDNRGVVLPIETGWPKRWSRSARRCSTRW